MNDTQKDYKNLHKISQYGRTLAGVSSLLEWDHETYMPPAAAGIRAEQLKALAGIVHKEKTSKKFANALGKLIDIKSGKVLAQGLPEKQQAALKE